MRHLGVTREAAEKAMGCKHKAADGTCNRLSDNGFRQPCVDGPCAAEAMEAKG